MKPLKNMDNLRIGYTFGVPTSYNNFHLGTDYIIPSGTPIYAPFNCIVTRSGSKTSELGIRADVKVKGFVMRFGHLQAVLQEGMVVKGTKFAESDNTGTLTQGSHLHLDISKGDKVVLSDHTNFVDPQKFNWNGDYDYFALNQGEDMTEDEYREVVANVVNGFY